SEDMVTAAMHGWILSFDNLSSISDEISDELCRLVTGAGHRTRKLYTQGEEFRITVRRPVILNGISNLVERGDLQDRSVILTLPPMPAAQRKEKAQQIDEFEKRHARILGWLLDAAVMSLRNFRSITAPLPRLADFGRWVLAGAPVLGTTEAELLDLINQNA